MNKNEIIHILRDWNFWDKDQKTGIDRPFYLSKLEAFHASNQIITITGPRRAGKSFIMRQMAKRLISRGLNPRNILHVNFEDPRFTETGVDLLQQIFEVYQEYMGPENKPVLFLDEIQEIKGFEKWVRMMHELSKAKIVISGSNADLLSRELGTLLTGRHLDLEIYPLSFGEFLSFNGVSLSAGPDVSGRDPFIRGHLRKYLEFGAFPEIALSDQKKEILLNYFEDVITKDLLRRYRIRKGQDLRSMVKYYLSNAASLSTFNSIERALDITVPSVKNYTHYLEQAYLVFALKRFSFKVREQEKSPRKTYAVDTGLCNAVGFRFSENTGRLAENIVFMTLKRGQVLDRETELFYWKDAYHNEVDFVVKKGLKDIRLIQVCWNMSDEKTKNREFRALSKAMKELKVDEATVITEDGEGEEDLHGNKVRMVSFCKWLLSEEVKA